MSPFAAARWRFLDDEPTACAVVTERMEVIFLNRPARALATPEWLGRRCWQVFPVKDTTCASRCPAIRTIHQGPEITYCEEEVHPPGGPPLRLGVAVVPHARIQETGGLSLLLLRAAGEADPADFRDRLLADAEALCARLRGALGAERSDGAPAAPPCPPAAPA